MERIQQHVLPNNKTDAVTMLHDIDYLRYAGNKNQLYKSDLRAIIKSDNTLPGIVTKLGLGTKLLLGLDSFHKTPQNITDQQARDIGNHLFDAVVNDEGYVRIFNRFGVKLE